MEPELKRATTSQMMQQHSEHAGVQCAIVFSSIVCCFWLPMLFLMAAANVPDKCEKKDGLKTWLQVYGIVPMAVGILVQLLIVVFALMKVGFLFKLSLRLHGVSMCVSIALIIWGWIVYAGTDADCDGDDHPLPRTMTLVFLILGSIGLPCALCMAVAKTFGDVHEVSTTVHVR